MPKRTGIFFINLYQKTISPDHGIIRGLYPHGFCRYYPTCSQYTKEAIEHRGIIIGAVLGCWRILRCNPWSKGGHDPVGKSMKHEIRKTYSL